MSEYLDDLGLPAATREAAGVYLRCYGSAYEDSISALHLLRRLAAAGSLSEFVLSGASYPLVEGTGWLIGKMVAELAIEIRLGSPVLRLEQDGAQVVIQGEWGQVRSAVVVMTVPPGALTNIEFVPPLSEARHAFAGEGLAGRGLKVWALARNVPADFSACGDAPGLDMVWSEQTARDDLVLLAGYGPDVDALDGNEPAAVQKVLQAFIPAAEVVACASHPWANDPYSRETWDVFRPGQIRRYERALRIGERRIIFAGSYTAYSWPGFIDGAIESGIRAAREADHLVGRRAEARIA
jgi:monoamine oxidase